VRADCLASPNPFPRTRLGEYRRASSALRHRIIWFAQRGRGRSALAAASGKRRGGWRGAGPDRALPCAHRLAMLWSTP
jgi:hypothetical protein